MSIDIDKLTVEELEALNHRIVQRLKMLDTLDAHKAMMEFNLGSRASFDSPKEEWLAPCEGREYMRVIYSTALGWPGVGPGSFFRLSVRVRQRLVE